MPYRNGKDEAVTLHIFPLPGLAFERIECFPASLINLFVTFFYRTFLGEELAGDTEG